MRRFNKFNKNNTHQFCFCKIDSLIYQPHERIRAVAVENYNITTSDAVIKTQIMNAINFGTLKYLDPLELNPVSGLTEIITINTTLRWTNQ